MRILKYSVIALFVISTVFLHALAEEDEPGEGGMSHLQETGEGEYLSDPGEMTQMDDLGGGQYMREDGSVVEMDDLGEGQYMTTGDDMMQIDRSGDE